MTTNTTKHSISLPERAAAILATLTDEQIRTITRVWGGERASVTPDDTVLAELIETNESVQRLTILGMVLVGLPDFAAKVLDGTGGSLSGLGDPALDALEEVISKLEALTPEQVEAAELRLKLMQAERPAPISSSAADQRLVLLVALLAVGSVALTLALLNSCRR